MTFFNIFTKKKVKKEKLKILINNREKNSLVASKLVKLGFEIQFSQLPVGDYIINNTAVERKTISDLKSSIINKRIMQQLLELRQYPSYFLILEGLENEDIYSGIIHENAFRGFLLSTILEYKVPVIFTLNEEDTAKYLSVLAKKQPKSEPSIRASKIFLSEKEQLQFILEGFPNIGPATAKKILEHYKTLKNFINSTEEELKNIIGKKAELVYNLISRKY